MTEGGATAADSAVLEREDIERRIAELLDAGLEPNRWRPDFEALRHRRLWDEKYHDRRLRMLLREWRRVADGAVLDVGSGRGGLAVALLQRGYRVVAADLRLNNCRIARLRGRRYGLDVPAVRSRGERMPFRDESFAAIVCRDVLEHCQHPGHLLAELWRVLRAGGSCFITVINRWCWVDPHYHLRGLAMLPATWAERYIVLRGRSKRSGDDRQRISDMHYYRYGEFVRSARDFGFAVRDLDAESRERYKRDGLINRLRWVRGRLLRPLSIHADHFELLLCKPRAAKGARR